MFSFFSSRFAELEPFHRRESGGPVPAFQRDNGSRFKVSKFPVRQEELVRAALEIALTFTAGVRCRAQRWKQKLLSPTPTGRVDFSSLRKAFVFVVALNSIALLFLEAEPNIEFYSIMIRLSRHVQNRVLRYGLFMMLAADSSHSSKF